MPTSRVRDTTGDDLGLIEHPAPNVEPGDVVVLEDGREALVTACVEAESRPLAALLGVAFAPTPLTSDDSVAKSVLPSCCAASLGSGKAVYLLMSVAVV